MIIKGFKLGMAAGAFVVGFGVMFGAAEGIAHFALDKLDEFCKNMKENTDEKDNDDTAAELRDDACDVDDGK